MAVTFPDCIVDYPIHKLSSEPPPPLPGGYAVGDTVLYTGHSGVRYTFASGQKLTRGQEGEVTGAALGPRRNPKRDRHSDWIGSTSAYSKSIRTGPEAYQI